MKAFNIKTVIVLVNVLLVVGGYAQSTDIVGHYPLRSRVVNPDVGYAKFTEVGTYDISHDGNHGEIIPNSGIKANQAFDVATLEGKTYLKGKSQGRINLVKDPFETTGSQALTIAFWLEAGASGIVLQTKYVKVSVTGTQIHFQYRLGTQDVIQTETLVNPINGWYNVAFVHSQLSGKKIVYCQGQEIGDYTSSSGVVLTSSFLTSFITVSGFSGGLANVVFSKEAYAAINLPSLNDIIDGGDQAYASRMFRRYPLDASAANGYATETIDQQNATSVSGVSQTTNRFGTSGGAAQFSSSGKMVLPYILGQNPSTDDYDESKGFTVSLWVKKTVIESTPQTGIGPVLSPTDTKYSILYGKDGSGNPLFGTQRVKDRLGIYTYLERSGTKTPWYNWYYDPVSFRSETGWFHIIYVQGEYYNKTYMAKYGEDINCDCAVNDWDCWRDCQMHYDYTSFKSLVDITEWGLGDAGGDYRAETIIDDVRIYRWPMDVEQVTALHSYENNDNPNVNNVTFAVIGDQGCEGTDAADVATFVKSFYPEYVLGMGDDNYADFYFKGKGCGPNIDANMGQYYHEFIYPYTGDYGSGSYTLENRFWSVLGNHDYKAVSGQPSDYLFTEWKDFFSYPNNERYYDKLIGDVHIFAINNNLKSNGTSEDPDGASATSTQGAWLQTKLANSTAKYKIVVCHVPPYSQQYVDPNTGAKDGAANSPVLRWPFKAWGASAVFSGDQHFYERNTVSDFTYVVNGLGGANVIEDRTLQPLDVGTTEVHYQGGQYGAMICETTPSEMTCTFYTVDGTQIDQFVIPASTSGARIAGAKEIFSVADEGRGGLVVFPNVSDGRFDIRFKLENPSKTYLDILTLQGATVRTEELEFNSGLNVWKVDASKLSSGLYLVKVRSDEFSDESRLLIAK